MSDNVILLSGIFCFSLALVGMVLTVLEFRRMGNTGAANPDREPARSAASRGALRT
jgi:hypothetical protein